LEDRGFELIPAWERLNEFNSVQNTYLGIFSTLGGLGLLLGTAGLGIVTGRNILERRGQLALLNAVGFSKARLGQLIVWEHWFLHGAGVVLGIVAGLAAILPPLLSRSGSLPIGLLIFLNALILAGGLVFCWLAARLMLRENLSDSLRHE
jgi:ABC-type antimicrobial peptide transport system permease subunit